MITQILNLDRRKKNTLTMRNLRIVQATSNDVHVIVPLFDSYRRFYGQDPNLAGAQRFLKERLDGGESVVFLAFEAGRAVCFAQLYPSFSSVQMKRLWILNDLFVTPQARAHGVGAALLEECKQLAKKTDAKGLVLETRKDNQEAQRLYEKFGWKRDETFITYYLDVLN